MQHSQALPCMILTLSFNLGATGFRYLIGKIATSSNPEIRTHMLSSPRTSITVPVAPGYNPWSVTVTKTSAEAQCANLSFFGLLLRVPVESLKKGRIEIPTNLCEESRFNGWNLWIFTISEWQSQRDISPEVVTETAPLSPQNCTYLISWTNQPHKGIAYFGV